MTQIIENMSDISGKYGAIFCDLWGCVHNGIEPFEGAIAALQDYRAKGGVVMLVTNAPRQRASVAAQLDNMGLPRDCWDDIATSGDSARAAMFTGAVGNKVYFIGQPHDDVFFEPLKLVKNPVPITQVELAEAEGIVCCGPFDPLADPDKMRPTLMMARERGLKLLCANPDIVVDRGENREWCAGKLAQMYIEMGGESLYFGKPHPPIYELARQRLAALGHHIADPQILCVGDGMITDIAGAMGEDMDALFISGGLAAAETKTMTSPDPDALNRYLADQQMSPRYTIGFLR